MPTSIRNYITVAIFFIACHNSSSLFASHIAGGGFTYRYLGDTVVSGQTLQKYRVSLELYQDCVTGVPEAIAQDNPAFFTLYEVGGSTPKQVDTNIYYSPTSGSATVTQGSVSSPCGIVPTEALPALCLLKKTFSKIYYLAEHANGYVVVSQRCCRNAGIENIMNPGDNGSTYYCTIPPKSTAPNNNSAQFNLYPPQLICKNISMVFDHSATDTDGDSLTYELCAPLSGADGADIKPKVATPPPYNHLTYSSPYTYANPMNGDEQLKIDARTGKMTVTPNQIGLYLIGVQCNEWRGGVIINTTRREYQWMVVDCHSFQNNYKPDAGVNRTVLVGDTISFNATGSSRYYWVPGDFLSNAHIGNPIGTFTNAGEYTYTLFGVSDPGCNGKDTIKITVLDHSDFAVPNAFTPNNDGRNDLLIPMPIDNSLLKSFRVFNRWGNLIYQTNTPGAGWDGTYKGATQDMGVYSWAIEYTDNKGTPRTKGGTVMLLR